MPKIIGPIVAGALVFLPWAIVEAALAAAVLPLAWRLPGVR